MKNLLLLPAALLLLLTASCGHSKHVSQPSQPGMVKAPEMLVSTISRMLYSKDKLDSAASTVTYQFFTVPQFPWQDSVNRIIGDFFWQSMQFESGPYMHQPLTHAFFYERMQQFAESSDIATLESAYPVIWSYDGSDSIDLSLKKYAQLNIGAYIYSGGAHPNGFAYTLLISKETGETLKFADLTSDSVQFNSIAEKYFRQIAELGPQDDLEAAGFWFEGNVFSCNNNFSVDKEGITFYYNSYEIAPYAWGPTVLLIPMAEVRHLLAVDLSFN
jgi:hypothetical protein